MIVDSVEIRNFRSILHEILHCEALTALVGANGSGKSAFLRGLDLFYAPSPRVEPADFYAGDATSEISVAVTFRDLSPKAKSLFSSYLEGDTLTVERVLVWDNGKVAWKYHGAALRNPLFREIRDALAIKDRGATAKDAYNRARGLPDFAALPLWSSLGAAEASLKQWEVEHPDQCSRERDDGQFFGFKEVAQGYLGRFTRFLFIPAVRDASEDSAEGKGSVLTALMDLVVRNALAANEDLMKFRQETQTRYLQILDPVSRAELLALADGMTRTLKTFIPDADVRLDLQWLPLSGIDIPLPQADVRLVEDGYASAVMRTGHGLQRAFILTILQHLAFAGPAPSSAAAVSEPLDATPETDLPDLVLAIEEPELYQHPNRQRHLAKILLQLASGKVAGVAEKSQIIYATHSPLFVGIDRINQIRVCRKKPNGPDRPKITKIINTSLDRVAEIIWAADGKPGQQYSGVTLLPRLQAVMTPWMSEGFFADVVVLVEGEDDRAALLGVSSALGHDLEGQGIAVIPCYGKTNLDRPAVIFQQLGIPVYLVWDSDKGQSGSKAEDNHRLLRLLGQTLEDWPCQVSSRFACFECNLQCTLRTEIGEAEFDAYLQCCQDSFCIPKKEQAIKNPMVVARLLSKAREHGHGSPSLEAVIKKVLELRALRSDSVHDVANEA